MRFLKAIFKKKQKIKEKIEDQPKKIVLSYLPEVPGLQAQTEIVVEDEGVDIAEEGNNEEGDDEEN